jgi:glucosamine-6-phosphate deaminase
MAISLKIFTNAAEAATQVARELSELIRIKPDAVLGLATGGTPLLLYRELIRMHRKEGLSFSQVRTWNLDEYEGLARDHVESYWHFMHQNLFDHIDISAENIHIPSGVLPTDEVDAHCVAYEEAIRSAGGIDYQILGIGRNGHIGFNEPGSAATSRTRRVELCSVTRSDAAVAFGSMDRVPSHAITMGCGTILEAKTIALLAFGAHKADIVKQALYGPVSEQISASYLQQHGNTTFYLDAAATGAV